MKALIFILPFILGFSAKALTSPVCAFYLKTPPVIKNTPRGWYHVESRRAGGEVYRFGQKVPEMASNSYVYLVTDLNELVVAPKYDVERFLTTGQGLLTHKTLARLYRARTGKDLRGKVVAAGEFVLAYGEITFITNKSGNFRGNERSLDYAIAILPEFGFRMAPGFVKLLITKDTPKHMQGHSYEERTFDRDHLRVMAEVIRHPSGRELILLYESLGRVLKDIYGDRAGVGGAKIIAEKGRAFGRRASQTFTYPLLKAATYDNIHLGLFDSFNVLEGEARGNPLKQLPPDPEGAARRYFNITGPRDIETILMDTEFPRTAEQEATLRHIAAEFAAIPLFLRP